MTIKLCASLFIAASLLLSCANKDATDTTIIPEQSNTAPLPASTEAQPTVATGTESVNLQPTNTINPGITTINPQAKNVTINPQTNAINVSPVTNAATGPLNPAHGEPGHRCDISVGAPLNSKPNATPQPTVVQTPINLNTNNAPNVNITQQPTITKTAPGMNPPHGESGHRCDITVGEPLNSKPLPAKTDSSKN